MHAQFTLRRRRKTDGEREHARQLAHVLKAKRFFAWSEPRSNARLSKVREFVADARACCSREHACAFLQAPARMPLYWLGCAMRPLLAGTMGPRKYYAEEERMSANLALERCIRSKVLCQRRIYCGVQRLQPPLLPEDRTSSGCHDQRMWWSSSNRFPGRT